MFFCYKNYCIFEVIKPLSMEFSNGLLKGEDKPENVQDSNQSKEIEK